jgi:putative membrane protein
MRIKSDQIIPALSLLSVILVFIWSSINPFDRFTWWLEIAPVLIVVIILIPTFSKFQFTNLAYILIAFHAIILCVGGHYTYARVPYFDEIGALFGSGRNSYDGLGHLAQGFIPAIVLRELIIRTSNLRDKFWIFYLVLFSCLGFSACYELIEYCVAVMSGTNADEFLGTQGDVWDTQKDMALAGVGAILAQWTLSRMHDVQLKKFTH